MVARKQATFNRSDCVTTAKTQVARVEMRALEIVGRSSGVFDLPSGLFRNIKAVSARYSTRKQLLWRKTAPREKKLQVPPLTEPPINAGRAL